MPFQGNWLYIYVYSLYDNIKNESLLAHVKKPNHAGVQLTTGLVVSIPHDESIDMKTQIHADIKNLVKKHMLILAF